MESQDPRQRRIEQLESSLTYLQSDFETLNSVVLEIHGRLDQLQATMQRLTLRLEAVQEPEAPRSLEDERPPHY